MSDLGWSRFYDEQEKAAIGAGLEKLASELAWFEEEFPDDAAIGEVGVVRASILARLRSEGDEDGLVLDINTGQIIEPRP